MTEASNQTPGAGRVGTLSRQVISALNLPIKNETPIYLGETNIDHMKRRHPAEQAPPRGARFAAIDSATRYGLPTNTKCSRNEFTGR